MRDNNDDEAKLPVSQSVSMVHSSTAPYRRRVFQFLILISHSLHFLSLVLFFPSHSLCAFSVMNRSWIWISSNSNCVAGSFCGLRREIGRRSAPSRRRLWPAMALSGMRGLSVFVSDIRNCQNKEQVRLRVDKELGNIRKRFKTEKVRVSLPHFFYFKKLAFDFSRNEFPSLWRQCVLSFAREIIVIICFALFVTCISDLNRKLLFDEQWRVCMYLCNKCPSGNLCIVECADRSAFFLILSGACWVYC